MLLATMAVATVLFILSGAYVSSSLGQNQVVRGELSSMKAFYLAEKGIEYAFIEAYDHGWNWRTHQVANENALDAVDTADRPTIALGTVANYDAGGIYEVVTDSGEIKVKAYPDPDRTDETWVVARGALNGAEKILRFKISTHSLYKYFFFFPSTKTFSGATYDGKGVGGIHVNKGASDNGDIVLGGTATNFQRLTELSCPGYIYYASSKYNSPLYYDRTDKNLNGGTETDSMGLLTRYAYPDYNYYENADMRSVSNHFSGNTAKVWIDKDVDGVKDAGEEVTIPKQLPGANAWGWNKYAPVSTDAPAVEFQLDRNTSNQLVHNPVLITTDSGSLMVALNNPLDFLVDQEERTNEYATGNTNPTVLSKSNDISIGGNQYSEYNIYRYIAQKDTIPSGLTDLQAFVAGVAATGFWDYWKTLHASPLTGDNPNVDGWKRIYWESWYNYIPTSGHQTPPSDKLQEWWQDLKFGDDYNKGNSPASVDYLNTQYQLDAWENWLASQSLTSIIKEKNTGGVQEFPLNIETNYSQLAKTSGLYIDSSGVYLNGAFLGSALPAWLTDNVEFYNTVFPHKDAANNAIKENVLEIDVANLISNYAEQNPGNHVVYVAHKNVRLVNASQLPSGGLTVVSPYNVYVKGSYNTGSSWYPSSVITNSRIFLLSGDFNDPQNLPVSYNYKEYPYSLEFKEFTDSCCWGAGGERWPASIASKKPASKDALTMDWIKKNLTSSEQKTLLSSGESYYDVDNASNKSDLVSQDTRYNVACVSAYDPIPFVLERWSNDVGSANQKKIFVNGAFIQLAQSWSSIRDVPAQYNRKATKGWGGSNSALDPARNYEYEDKFASSASRPSGDFFSGLQAVWQEVYDFEHHVAV